ncbi:GTP pyrophosphokinase [Mycolicibacterium llatzerense]|uniref:GTP pyrophosphokinase n=1 Tax=Mycolicibacterium llatzerense TaxID=280871 RepID=UPI0021B5FC20|nr:hypothetical protein [Mycolicibacterium llatzerense]
MSDQPDEHSLASNELPFTYDQMKAWYENLKTRQLEPALTTASRYLQELIEEHLTEFDRHRIKLRPGRIKSPARLWDKIGQAKYAAKLQTLDDIPTVIDDLVGIRIVCNNMSDISAVQTMLTSLPDPDEDDAPPMTIDAQKVRAYHETPKPSGYRAYHVNLLIRIGSGVSQWNIVSVELQVRTLLQDGWGELTHEDTYKPGAQLPPNIATLARRMASLLSCVDELAQDLRDQLDNQATPRIAEEATSSETNEISISSTTRSRLLDRWENLQLTYDPLEHSIAFITPQPTIPEGALLDETRSIVEKLDKPTTLASVAFQLQTLFGNHISRQHWGRFGNFKSLLLEAVPNVHIENVGPSWIIPPGFTRDDIPGDLAEFDRKYTNSDIPEVIRKLRQFDTSVPAVPSSDLKRYIDSAGAALDDNLWNELEVPRNNGVGIQHVNLLSKTIRDRMYTAGHPLSRPKLGYILLALLNTGNLRPGLGIDAVKTVLSAFLISRIRHNGIDLAESDVAEINTWLDHQ